MYATWKRLQQHSDSLKGNNLLRIGRLGLKRKWIIEHCKSYFKEEYFSHREKLPAWWRFKEKHRLFYWRSWGVNKDFEVVLRGICRVWTAQRLSGMHLSTTQTGKKPEKVILRFCYLIYIPWLITFSSEQLI